MSQSALSQPVFALHIGDLQTAHAVMDARPPRHRQREQQFACARSIRNPDLDPVKMAARKPR